MTRTEEQRFKARKNYRQLKNELIQRYGGSCACCGENAPEFLTFDHVGGGGNQERKRLGNTQIYSKLSKAPGTLPGYRLLCANCNQCFALKGYCIHFNLDIEDTYTDPLEEF